MPKPPPATAPPVVWFRRKPRSLPLPYRLSRALLRTPPQRAPQVAPLVAPSGTPLRLRGRPARYARPLAWSTQTPTPVLVLPPLPPTVSVLRACVRPARYHLTRSFYSSAAPFGTLPPPPPPPLVLTYRVQYVGIDEDFAAALNDAGNTGWTLVSWEPWWHNHVEAIVVLWSKLE